MKWTRVLALIGVFALGAFGATACSDDNPVDVADPPGTPTGLTVSVAGQTFEITWTAAANATSYRVVVTTAGETDRTTEGITDTSLTVGSLTAGTTYFVQVYAIGDGGASSPASTSAATDDEPETVVQVTADILTNTTWTSDKTWVLNQPIFVGVDCGADGADPDCVSATLTIEPGTTIVGKTDVPQGVRGAYLVVSRGSRIIADATGGEDRPPTAEEVIVFTSDKPRGQRAVEDWGGIVINGRAPTNSGDEAEGEGDSGLYGGDDPEDSSGILRGVRIEFAGDNVTDTDQLNGLAPQGVGSGTTISYLQIHYNKDDGIEPFGGTVSFDHVVLTGIGDDTADGTDGYRGFIQFLIGQQRGADADNGFELSTNGDDGSAFPGSTAVIANATMIGARDARVDGEIAGAESDDGIQFREGSNYRVYNSILTGFGNSGMCIRDAVTIVNANNRMGGDDDPTSTLSAEGLILWNNGGADDSPLNLQDCGGGSTQALNTNFFNTAGFNNMIADPGFDDSAFDIGTMTSPPDFTLAAMPGGYTAFDLSGVAFDGATLFEPGDGRTLVDTDYAGAIEPGTALANAWYNGWTVWTIDGSDSRPNSEGN